MLAVPVAAGYAPAAERPLGFSGSGRPGSGCFAFPAAGCAGPDGADQQHKSKWQRRNAGQHLGVAASWDGGTARRPRLTEAGRGPGASALAADQWTARSCHGAHSNFRSWGQGLSSKSGAKGRGTQVERLGSGRSPSPVPDRKAAKTHQQTRGMGRFSSHGG